MILLGIFILAGATTYQFFKGRRKNLELMRLYVKELERGLKPLDKNYTILGIYSGFKADFKISERGVERVEASIGLMPRESLLYYPISMLTLKHDRFYLVLRLSKRPKSKCQIVKEKVLKYSRADLNKDTTKEVSLHGEKYLVDCPLEIFEKLKELVVDKDVLHVALTPETKVLYVFAKPKPGLVEKVSRKALEVARALSAS
ncbi:hypothetical protein IPA_05285 [Ignicoccus pacificus DSM 13166]|uniref:Uncharacterized protein n=1 Tax=Ignicoccus pacificus DSM 13166 TaxID=940294 RepID=A0A977KBB5_9CREN|nr:hypothetical protein IPA_05285 [Ignicoccus pacificus DSM 13166]